MSAPVPVAAARVRGLATYERRCASWAVDGADAVVLDLPLHPPTESAALADTEAAVAWVRSWRALPGVAWGRRRWANLGEQEVPERLRLDNVAALAAFVGRAGHWRTLSSRAAELTDRFGTDVGPALRRHARALVDQSAADHARLIAVVDWLVAHPDSGLYLRQLPVAGVDTKWLESRHAWVTALVTACGHDGLGLRQPPGLVRLRCDPGLAPGGLRDFAAPVEEVDRLALSPDRVLVVENLQTMLAVPDRPGLVVVHGTGYAVNRLGDVGWIRDAPILYWGDLDGDGFAILDRIRAHCPRVDSLLMDSATLLAHRDLWGADPNRPPGILTRLTAAEAATLALLGELGGVRLEQERLAWPGCVSGLDQALAVGPTTPGEVPMFPSVRPPFDTAPSPLPGVPSR